MKTRIAIGSIIIMFILSIQVNAGGKDELQKFFRDTANKVNTTENASEKRKILNESFQTMSKTLDMVQSSSLISRDDRNSLNSFKASLQEKYDELMGNNGYQRVPDAQLNAFSVYVVQDMEQAAETVTISIVALILIIILVVLLL